jgi:winged helix DNA-binding protein
MAVREATLTLRGINRATLARQLLLRRATTLSAAQAIEHLVGMQAQNPSSPYFALWARLSGFEPATLGRWISERRAVRASLMRATIHLVTARDFRALRPLVQPVLDRALKGTFGRRLAGVNTDAVALAGRSLLRERPLTGAELGTLLQKRWPDRDARILAYAVQFLAPLVQAAPRGVWGAGGQTAWMIAEDSRARRGGAGATIEDLVTRYLGAFGPASVRDMCAWSGLRRLGEVFERLRPRLRTFRDERGSELFDLPRAPRPDAATPAPPRFLPDYDNVLLAHADRRRIISDDHRARVGIGQATVLVDGFVRAAWKIERTRVKATLVIEPLERIRRQERVAVAEEGRALLAFAASDANSYEVRIANP